MQTLSPAHSSNSQCRDKGIPGEFAGQNKDGKQGEVELLLRNKKIKLIFINIFGGIVRCNRIADGIIQAVSNNPTTVPLIVRLDGTNAKEATGKLTKARINNIIPATDFADGAQKGVAATQ